MPKISLASPLRYGIALLSVILATVIRLALDPLLGNHFPLFAFFVAIVFTAWHCGSGPSFLALVLSWWSADYFLLQRRGSLSSFELKSHIAFPFFAIGLTVILLFESVRAAQRRAKASASEAQRALESQQAHREWLRITLASIADAVITTDSEGLVTSLNPVAERLTGWGAPEAVGRPLEEVFRTVEEATYRATDLPVANVVRGGEVVLSDDHPVLIARDGVAKFVEYNAAPIKDDQGKITGVIIILRDITERRRAEEALRESEERFRQLAEHITDIFWIADPHLSQTLYVSPAYEAIWGHSCHSVYERPWSFLEAVHPEDRDRLLVALRRQAKGQTTAEEYRIVRPDGSVRWIWDRGFPIEDETGEVVRVAGIAEDITDRRRAEEEVRHQTQILKTITDNADSALVLLDVRGHCTFINPAFTRLTGYTEDDIRGRPVLDAVHDKDPQGRPFPIEECPIDSSYWKHKPIRGHEDIFVRKDGTPFPVVVSVAPLEQDGETVGGVMEFRDVTKEKAAEEALREADRRKEEFLAVLSHELRNPLASIQTALDLMRQAAMTAAEFERERAVMERQVGHLTRLVDDLLDVSRISRGRIELHKEVVVLAAVIAEVIEAVQPQIEERHQELQISLPEESIRLEADPTRLEQILLNLLTNAAKYTDLGGQIMLSAERHEDEVEVRVRDTGIGIAHEMLPRIFDLFVQGERRLDRALGGLGIGLSLVKSLVEMHGGSITAHSQGPGMGSEFVVRLPVLSGTQAHEVDSPQPVLSDAPEVLPRRRILIVDDNAVAADGLGRLLSLVYGQDVRVVYDGPSALDLAGSFQPEVVLLDLGMAVMDGYEVAKRLRERPESAGALIVAVTGWGQEEDRRRSREVGFDLHLVKPVNADALRGLLTFSELVT
ncbi:MAG: PAS domain S-box protein [Planctomycetaceae bacterium]|nr:PAS domain S-box protein [Planctomycetaceae bacterium]